MMLNKRNKEGRGSLPTKRLSFRWKLFLSFAVVVLIPLLAWTLAINMETNDKLLRQVNDTTDRIFVRILSDMERTIADLAHASTFVSSDSTIGQALAAPNTSEYLRYYDVTFRLDPTTNTLLFLHPEITDITFYVTNTLWQARSSFLPVEKIRQLPEYDLVKRNYDPIWTSDETNFYLTRRILVQNGGVLQPVLRLTIDKQLLLSDILQTDSYHTALIVRDADGQRIFGAGSPSMLEMEKEAPSVSSAWLHRQAPIEGTTWQLHQITDSAPLLLDQPWAFRTTLFLLMGSLILMLIVSILLSRSLTARITHLSAFLSRAPSQRFMEDLPVRNGDEVDGISNAVGSMVMETRRLIKEVYESRIQIKDSEMRALQSQINPHFLYNTLSKINWISIRKGEDEISRIVSALSSFYRSTLNRGSFMTTVGLEISTTRAYVDIQLYVHDNAFDVTYDLAPEILRYQMPGIILQPLVENAIEHGLRMRSGEGKGNLCIRGFLCNQNVILEVIDNGPGMKAEQVLEALQDKSHSYGLRNVNNRLVLLYGNDYGLVFRENAEGGLTAIVKIPVAS